MPTIEILDSVHCRADAKARKLILPCLEYKDLVFKPAFYKGMKKRFYKKEKIEVVKKLITGRNNTSGLFYSGLLERIKEKFPKIKIKGEMERLTKNRKTPKLKKIKLRQDQVEAIQAMVEKQRGVIQLPTGSGKTIIALGFISMFSEYRIIFLCNTLDLIRQTKKELEENGMDCDVLTGEDKINWKYYLKKDKCILLSTIQSLSKVKIKEINSFFDITIVDEVHFAAKENSLYGEFMKSNLSPVKIGLTATLPTNEYEKMVLEGFFGKVIYKIDFKKGKEIGIIVKAKVKLLPVPKENAIDLLINRNQSYANIYKEAIVHNISRNNLIIKEAIETIEDKKRVLIIVEKIEHGEEIKKLFEKKNILVPFVRGSTDKDLRMKVKENIKEYKENVAICTKVWKVGVNIPSLDKIIYAAGMKEEKSVIQAMGRGLRIAKNKNKIELVDFMDPYKTIAEHSILRFTIYKKLGWIK